MIFLLFILACLLLKKWALDRNEAKAEFTQEDLRKWWVAWCPECQLLMLSGDCYGGRWCDDLGEVEPVKCSLCETPVLEAPRDSYKVVP